MQPRRSWPHFSEDELQCKCDYDRCRRHFMEPAFMSRLESLRVKLNIPLSVTSGYRCPAYNVLVSTSGPYGPHTTGHAVDIRIGGEAAFELIVAALNLGFTGFGIRQHGDWSRRFVHLDDLTLPSPRPRIWTYS